MRKESGSARRVRRRGADATPTPTPTPRIDLGLRLLLLHVGKDLVHILIIRVGVSLGAGRTGGGVEAQSRSGDGTSLRRSRTRARVTSESKDVNVDLHSSRNARGRVSGLCCNTRTRAPPLRSLAVAPGNRSRLQCSASCDNLSEARRTAAKRSRPEKSSERPSGCAGPTP